MSIKFEVKMTERMMYDFHLYHNYTRLSGLLGAIVGVLGLWKGIDYMLAGELPSAGVGFLIAVLFLIMTPIQLKNTAKRQVETTPMFQKPLEYELNDEGIVIRQDEAEALNAWDDFAKAVSTNHSIILYITRMRALILPKECMGEQYESVVKMISTHMPPAKVKIRHIH